LKGVSDGHGARHTSSCGPRDRRLRLRPGMTPRRPVSRRTLRNPPRAPLLTAPASVSTKREDNPLRCHYERVPFPAGSWPPLREHRGRLQSRRAFIETPRRQCNDKNGHDPGSDGCPRQRRKGRTNPDSGRPFCALGQQHGGCAGHTRTKHGVSCVVLLAKSDKCPPPVAQRRFLSGRRIPDRSVPSFCRRITVDGSCRRNGHAPRLQSMHT
jgi:hypothetical protein